MVSIQCLWILSIYLSYLWYKSKNFWPWDKPTISHSLVLAVAFHKADVQVEFWCQNYQVRYWGFIPWPRVLAIKHHELAIGRDGIFPGQVEVLWTGLVLIEGIIARTPVRPRGFSAHKTHLIGNRANSQWPGVLVFIPWQLLSCFQMPNISTADVKSQLLGIWTIPHTPYSHK